eukprot:TRINITY_DN3200_c0_g1_i1.p1 TRINITY_DN3200_c0_g1~~TRINITY_DN3200_c0_g1_i1.p1  ORF type:complete len:346 (-),score=89.36 TRINITY_DN3200_c0_g1_i1:71-1000(-)
MAHNAAHDVDALYKAMKGLGTDDHVLSEILATRSRQQLVEVGRLFESKYGKSLESWVKSETSGHYEDICVALICPASDYDAKLAHNAIAGLGTNDDQLIEVLCTRSNAELRELKLAYKRLFSKDLESDVTGDTSGDYKSLLVAVLRADRPEATQVDVEAAKKDAQLLYSAGEGKIGTDEQTFIDILTKRSFPHLHVVNQSYTNLAGHSLETGIAKETSGNFRKAMHVILTPREEYFALKIRGAIEGAGTDDKTLIRIIAYLSTNPAWMKAVNDYYSHRYGKSLVTDVSGDTSGWYGQVMGMLIKNRTAF